MSASLNITHLAVRPENNVVHGPVDKHLGSTWCPICRRWARPAELVDESFVAKLRPGIARFLTYGHDDNH